jgi:hypothetical protein
MSHGPAILYDKSAIQSLSKQEAFWLECHFRGVLIPTLLIEIIADLKKAAKEGRTPEAGVTNLADKIGALGTTPNVDFVDLITGDLLGYTVEMRRVPAIGGGRMVTAKDGQRGMVFDEPPEMEAVRRWRAGDFDSMEYALAEQWRQAIAAIDLGAVYRALKWTKGQRPSVKTLADVQAWVDTFIDNPSARAHVLKLALQFLPVPPRYHAAIVDRWKREGRAMLRDFAPYARHVLRVELFFYLSIASNLIGHERTTNRIDISYLYYLPFCSVFTSRDGLHKRTAPLFLAERQQFVDGDELKKDLARLDQLYAALPPEEKAKGSMSYARYPPLEGDFLVSRLWDRIYPGWREDAREEPIEITPERNAEIMAKLKPMLDAIKEDEQRRKTR